MRSVCYCCCKSFVWIIKQLQIIAGNNQLSSFCRSSLHRYCQKDERAMDDLMPEVLRT